MMQKSGGVAKDMTTPPRCASCGATESSDSDIKLRDCSACKLVKYCGVKCQRNHRLQHKKECKKRAAELLEELLFKQPESTHAGDCPICTLPMPIGKEHGMMGCCCTTICLGCSYANEKRQFEQRLDLSCPFCRCLPPTSISDSARMSLVSKRVEANDPGALFLMGRHFARQKNDHKRALEYFTKAIQLGDDAESHYIVALYYGVGERGVVEKDEKKQMYHLEKAAIRGHPVARHDLGAKHFVIAATLGYDKSVEMLQTCYKGELISKDEYAGALRAHKAAVEATKSPQRDEADVAFQRLMLAGKFGKGAGW